MFSKKCPRCERKISKDYDFCPYCGSDFRFERRIKKEKDYGFLGKGDISENFPNMNMGMSGISGMPLDIGNLFNSKLFNSLFNEVDKQFREMDKKMSEPKEMKDMSGISINISMSGDNKPDIKIRKFGDIHSNAKDFKEKKIPKNEMSDEEAKKHAKLPKKEAKAEVRRFSNKIVYEIELPGIKNLKDVIINKLENSIEIKAFSLENAYFKLLPVNLPILNYKLDNGKLILELKT